MLRSGSWAERLLRVRGARGLWRTTHAAWRDPPSAKTPGRAGTKSCVSPCSAYSRVVAPSELVERFLATQARCAPALGFMSAAAEGRVFADEVGIPCPDALALLGDAAMDYAIVIRVSSAVLGGEAPDTSFELLAPAAARDVYMWHSGERRGFEAPKAAPYMTMLPFANADGDVLLVNAAGAVHWLPFTLPSRACQVAGSFDDLLAAVMASGYRRPSP
jgi:hypothetical protein